MKSRPVRCEQQLLEAIGLQSSTKLVIGKVDGGKLGKC